MRTEIIGASVYPITISIVVNKDENLRTTTHAA